MQIALDGARGRALALRFSAFFALFRANDGFGKRVFELASEPKAALFHPRAGHNNLFAYPEVFERVIAFVREQVPGVLDGSL